MKLRLVVALVVLSTGLSPIPFGFEVHRALAAVGAASCPSPSPILSDAKLRLYCLDKKSLSVLDKAGIERKKLHDTRHTYATLLFAKGEHPKVVQEQMGHPSIKITLDIYSAYIPTMGRSAAERMESLFA